MVQHFDLPFNSIADRVSYNLEYKKKKIVKEIFEVLSDMRHFSDDGLIFQSDQKKKMNKKKRPVRLKHFINTFSCLNFFKLFF